MIKSFTLAKIFKDVDAIIEALKEEKYEEKLFGEEANARFLPEGLIEIFNSFNKELEVKVEESGIFRKPKNIIHCENVPSGLIYLGICAIKPTTITFYKHLKSESTNAYEINVTVPEILDDNIFPEAWEETNKEVLKEGEMFFFNPALWHKVESELIQVHYMYVKGIDEILAKQNAETSESAAEYEI